MTAHLLPRMMGVLQRQPLPRLAGLAGTGGEKQAEPVSITANGATFNMQPRLGLLEGYWRLTREGGGNMVLRRNRVEIGNSG